MKQLTLKYLSFLLGIAILTACEDVINPGLESAAPVYAVDAWITNSQQAQVVKLMRTQPYFDNSLPPGVSGANVRITDNQGITYSFVEGANAGEYIWTPAGNESFGEIGRQYTLTITINGETLTSTTEMNPVPPVDSITFNKQLGNQFIDDIYFAEFWATDLLPVGDAYWIKTYKNGVLLNKPSDINLAYDAAFSRGGGFTGVTFIAPVRTSVNPFDEDEDGAILSPYVVGDSLYVEVNSLSEQAFDFLTEVVIQTDRPGGFGELFSTPLANVPSNLRNTNPSGTKVVGFFNVAAVAGNGRKFKSLEEISRVF